MTEVGRDLYLRDAVESDLSSLLELLHHLSVVSPLSSNVLERLFNGRIQAGIVTRVVVHKPSSRIVASASMLVEPKFIRGGKYVGHIEDVVVDPSFRGQKLGQILIKDLCNIARARDCYKVILDCAEKSIGFYKDLGFQTCERQMRFDLSHL